MPFSPPQLGAEYVPDKVSPLRTPVKLICWAARTAPKLIRLPDTVPVTVPSLTQVELLMWMGPDSLLPATWKVIVKVPCPPGVTVLENVPFHLPATPLDEGGGGGGGGAGVVDGAEGCSEPAVPPLGPFELDVVGEVGPQPASRHRAVTSSRTVPMRATDGVVWVFIILSCQ